MPSIKALQNKFKGEFGKEMPSEFKFRLRSPSEFEPKSFRRKQVKKDPKVDAIFGRLKDSDDFKIQAFRFPKKAGWDIDKAKAWTSKHLEIAFGEAGFEPMYQVWSSPDYSGWRNPYSPVSPDTQLNPMAAYITQPEPPLLKVKKALIRIFNIIDKENLYDKKH